MKAWLPANEIGGTVAGVHDNVHPIRHLQVARDADGGKNGNAALQRLLEDVLNDYRDFVRPFVDDIIVSLGGATYEEPVHNRVEHLRLLCQRLREKKFAI